MLLKDFVVVIAVTAVLCTIAILFAFAVLLIASIFAAIIVVAATAVIAASLLVIYAFLVTGVSTFVVAIAAAAHQFKVVRVIVCYCSYHPDSYNYNVRPTFRIDTRHEYLSPSR